MRLRFLTLALVFAASPLYAQTHPCDTSPAAGTIRPSDLIGFGLCHNLKDTAGNKTPETMPQRARVVVDGVERFLGNVAPIGVANSLGLFYFETLKNLTFNAGSHTAKVSVLTDMGESLVATYFFTVSPAITIDTAPQRVRILKGDD